VLAVGLAIRPLEILLEWDGRFGLGQLDRGWVQPSAAPRAPACAGRPSPTDNSSVGRVAFDVGGDASSFALRHRGSGISRPGAVHLRPEVHP
jgi:hypothetical protein